MKASVLINNHNYAQYLGDAISSVLSQEGVDLELIVVDDGSSDDSIKIIQEWAQKDSRIKTVQQTNAGQLACFNKGISLASGEVVFLLDSDDVYKPGYLRAALDHYRENPDLDYVFCAMEVFGRESRIERPYERSVDLGYSAFRVLALGSPIVCYTSSMSAKLELLKRFMPIALEQDWKTRADDCISWGCSLVGGRKAYLDFVGMGYRIHERNAFTGRQFSSNESYQRLIKMTRIMTYFKATLFLDPVSARNWSEAELNSIGPLELRDLADYIRAALIFEPSTLLFVRRTARLIVIYLRRFFFARE